MIKDELNKIDEERDKIKSNTARDLDHKIKNEKYKNRDYDD